MSDTDKIEAEIENNMYHVRIVNIFKSDDNLDVELTFLDGPLKGIYVEVSIPIKDVTGENYE